MAGRFETFGKGAVVTVMDGSVFLALGWLDAAVYAVGVSRLDWLVGCGRGGCTSGFGTNASTPNVLVSGFRKDVIAGCVVNATTTKG